MQLLGHGKITPYAVDLGDRSNRMSRHGMALVKLYSYVVIVSLLII